MKKNLSIKLRAAFLLTVLTLNTVIAFACSIGINLGYNSHHHTNGNKKVNSSKTHCHSGKQTLSSTKKTSHHQNAVTPYAEETPAKDDCCNKNAVQFQRVDKSLAHAAKVQITTPVILLGTQYAYTLGIIQFPASATNRHHYFVRSDHPPIPDIRVAIQSFQV